MAVIFPEMVQGGMETSLQKRVRTRMDELGLNPFQTAKKAELGDSFVRDILRGKTRSPNAENLAKLADALETSPEWLLAKEIGKPAAVQAVGGLPVIGKIQAGNWIDRSLFDDDGEYEIIPVARDPRFPRAKQYSLYVEGDSMDRDYPDGCWVTCVDFADSGLPMKDGLIVHIERHHGSLVEMTLKAIETVDGTRMLVPRSSNPRHQPLPLIGDESTTIVIKGVVIGSYKRTII